MLVEPTRLGLDELDTFLELIVGARSQDAFQCSLFRRPPYDAAALN